MNAPSRHPLSNVISEEMLVCNLITMLSAEGYRIKREVSNMGQSVDIVATKGRWVTFVEAKIKNWKRALQQCRAHRTVADYVCIAIALKNIPNEFQAEAMKNGYGIIHYDYSSKSFNWNRRPIVNKSVWNPQRKHWAKKTRRVHHVN